MFCLIEKHTADIEFFTPAIDALHYTFEWYACYEWSSRIEFATSCMVGEHSKWIEPFAVKITLCESALFFFVAELSYHGQVSQKMR